MHLTFTCIKECFHLQYWLIGFMLHLSCPFFPCLQEYKMLGSFLTRGLVYVVHHPSVLLFLSICLCIYTLVVGANEFLLNYPPRLVFGYAYPAYECYKTVEKNKLEIEQLLFWCQYWYIACTLE